MLHYKQSKAALRIINRFNYLRYGKTFNTFTLQLKKISLNQNNTTLLSNVTPIDTSSFNRRLFATDLPPHIKITLPALSPTMERGTLAKWEKKEGDPVNEGDLLAEIETDKATVGLEASEEGYVAKILVEAGTRDIPLGQLLCIVVTDKNDVSAFANYKAGQEGSTSAPSVKVDSSSTHAPKTSVPPVSIIEQGEEDTEIPESPHKKALREAELDKQAEARLEAQPNEERQTLKSSKKGKTSKATTITSSPVPDFGAIPATPFAKALASEKGINLEGIHGSGFDGQITAEDLLKKSQSTPTPVGSSKPGAQYVDIELSNMRQTIAKRLLFSKQSIPHYYLTVEIDMTAIEKTRKQFNEMLEKDDIKLSVNDFIIKASALANMHHKECNSSWMDTKIRQYNSVDISVAVSTPAGLITPIIFDAVSKGVKTINTEMKQLAQKARAGKLQPQEFQGGTFTISNLGMFGIDEFTAIINPPQACILSIGTTTKKLVDDYKQDNGFRSISVMKVTLGCDHRVVDGAVGAQWLQTFKKLMENPVNMIL